MATLATLRALVRKRLGWPDADAFVTDPELDIYIHDALRELHALLVTVHGPDYFVDTEEFTTVPGQASYTIDSTEFARLIRIDCDVSGAGARVPFVKGNLVSHVFSPPGVGWTGSGPVAYFLTHQPGANGLRFDPTPTGAHLVRVFVAEDEVETLDDTDDNPIGHDEYVILDVMIKCRIKEESDASDIVALKAAYEARLRTYATPIDIGQPQTITDMRSHVVPAGTDLNWWRR